MQTVYHKIEDIPPFLASRTEWERRGYKIKASQLRNPIALFMNSVEYHLPAFWLYGNDQIELIRGKKAEARRKKYAHE